MKLTFLGTAAAEGFPAVFCNCDYCREARRRGGKNVRTRSQSLVNDDLLLDLPADTYHHFLQNGIEGHRIKHLFVTHSHEDHFYPDELQLRRGAYAHEMEVPILQVHLNRGAYEKNPQLKELDGIAVTYHPYFETVTAGDYQVTPLPARHYDGDGAVIYVVEGDKTLLYAHDTGYFFDGVFAYIQEKGLYFDLVTPDCTNVEIPEPDTGSHMALDNIRRVLAQLETMGAVDASTIKVVNHFSHNGCPLQEELEQKVAADGFLVAYDGLSILF